MSSDTVPIIQASAPPSYVDSQIQHSITTQQPSSSNNPPPYSPPSYVLESSGPSYQHFAVLEGPVTLRALNDLGKNPCLVICPKCEKQIMTVTKAIPGALTCLMASLCIFICLPCVVVPFCVDDLQDVSHSCPLCYSYIGTYTRI